MPVLLLLWLQAATGHPNALRMPAHVMSLHIDDQGVHLDYAVELPGHRHRGSTQPAEDAQSATVTLSGLTLYLDGTSESLTQKTLEGPRTTAKGSSVTRMTLHGSRVPLHTVTVENANYPDLQGYFSTAVTVGPGWIVEDSSVFSRTAGVLKASKAGTWQAGNQARSTSVSVSRVPRWRRVIFAPASGVPPVRSAWAARNPSWIESLWVPSPAAWILYLLCGTVLGLGRPEGLSRNRLLAGSVITVALTWFSTPMIIATAIGLGIAGRAAKLPGSQLLWGCSALLFACLGSPVLVVTCVLVTGVFAQRPKGMHMPFWFVGMTMLGLWLRAGLLSIG